MTVFNFGNSIIFNLFFILILLIQSKYAINEDSVELKSVD